MLSKIFGGVYNFFANLIGALVSWIAKALGWLLEKLFAFLKLLFKPLFILIAIIFYFLFKIAELFVLLFSVLLSIGKLFFALVKGLVLTITGLSFTPSTPNHGAWTDPMEQAFQGLSYFQLDKIAYVLLFAIWIVTAYVAIRILSNRGGS